MLVFWVVTPCGLDTNVSEEHTAPIFRATDISPYYRVFLFKMSIYTKKIKRSI
jgi:hypothetical protein